MAKKIQKFDFVTFPYYYVEKDGVKKQKNNPGLVIKIDTKKGIATIARLGSTLREYEHTIPIREQTDEFYKAGLDKTSYLDLLNVQNVSVKELVHTKGEAKATRKLQEEILKKLDHIRKQKSKKTK